MKDKLKVYVKLNLLSIFFIAISFISITLAWFAYSGLATGSMEMGVKAWNLEFQKNSTAISNDIVISLSDVYPGMETVYEKVDIKNFGDSDAQINYSITSARILDDEYKGDEIGEDKLRDSLAHDYPFHVNINLSKEYALKQTGESSFEVAISWPLDSDNDKLDSIWGNKSYEFSKNEEQRYQNDSTYQKRTPIKIVISIKAEQYIANNNSVDFDYDLGKQILYDVVSNKLCNEVSDTCLQTYILDVSSKLGDTSVILLPILYGTYGSGVYSDYDTVLSNVVKDWKVTTRSLEIGDILKPISKDILNSYIIREGLSNEVIGTINNNERVESITNKVINRDGYFTFDNLKYNYLVTNRCYWINKEYDNNNAFAFTKADEKISKIYKSSKNETCNIIPVIIAPKANIYE